ncbi:hypothetical protein ACFQ1E_16120 [Sphingomonas canadensis]|uniref:Uncharacterized protein n=1 Tax=Sphingomonas canadensis TaxID=1219257 RepID=A0ABW3H8V2_9SPHN|nr:hypothetical protein [Sphingomonas canadensis]MCW3837572.1 hypothetical protein [Sphingomonas canadensis]
MTGFGILLAAALSAPAPLPAQEAADPCAAPESYAHWLAIERKPSRPGGTLSITPTRGLSYVWEDEPAACTGDWQVSHPKMVTVAADRRSLIISKKAKPGTVVTISYLARGQRRSAQIRIVSKDAIVLTGTRTQTAMEGCPNAQPVGELEFRDDGGFSVTFEPFETYRDYWGRFTFDPASGTVEMTTSGGNFVPPDLKLKGKATLDAGGRLVLSGVHLGTRNGAPPPEQGCTYIF